MTLFKAACIQVNAGTDMGSNIATAGDFARRSRDEGAALVQMPENVAMMHWGRANLVANAHPEDSHPALAAFRDLARETGLWVHVGSLHVRLPGEDRLANRTYLIDPQGTIRISYDKIHMFDVDLGNGESYRESSTFRPGGCALTTELPWGRLGLSICYDLRFPQLYRALAKDGADFIGVPAAFTRVTGRAHWHVLLRARAIETGCFVLASAQCGDHINNRQTYGHSLIVSPWGEVLADAGEEPGYVIAEIDRARVDEARGKIPALTHDRDFERPNPEPAIRAAS